MIFRRESGASSSRSPPGKALAASISRKSLYRRHSRALLSVTPADRVYTGECTGVASLVHPVFGGVIWRQDDTVASSGENRIAAGFRVNDLFGQAEHQSQDLITSDVQLWDEDITCKTGEDTV